MFWAMGCVSLLRRPLATAGVVLPTILVCLDCILPVLQAVVCSSQPAVALGPIRLQLNTLQEQIHFTAYLDR